MVDFIIYKLRPTFKMAGTMNDVFTTMLTQNQSEEEPLFNEELLLFNLLQERSRKQLEAIYVAANMHPNTVIPLKTPEMELLL